MCSVCRDAVGGRCVCVCVVCVGMQWVMCMCGVCRDAVGDVYVWCV